METTLVHQIADSDARCPIIGPEDFEWIVRQHQRPIHRILLLILRNEDDADTLTQECFLRAFERRGCFRGDSSLGTWLIRIAINLAHDHFRNRRRAFWKRFIRDSGQMRAESPDPHRSQEHILLAREKVAIVWAAVDELPVQQRTAFVLRFVEEMSLQEIAGAMDLEVGTVKSHLSRALISVKQDFRVSGDLSRGLPKQI